MSGSTNYDFCILGAGMAGLSLADALQEQGYSVLVIEKNDLASGASGTPGGLVNPATGRKGKKVWKAEACYAAIRHNLEKVQEFAETDFFQNNGLLRPALSKKMAAKMKAQFDKTTWPGDWCHWQTKEQIERRHPGINCTGGGLWLPIALTVNVGAYLQAYASYLRSKKMEIITHQTPAYQQTKDSWRITISGKTYNSKNLVFATGYSTVDHPFWKDLKLEGVKGQVAKFRAPERLLSFDHSISSMGYIARLSGNDKFIQGSTYEHDFKDLNTDADGAHYLRSRMRKVLPELEQNATLVSQWAGVRVNTPNRKPVLGEHPQIKNLHIFTGLGSKGLLYGKFLAEHYADHRKNGTPILHEVSIKRFI